jgi:hypothetical protein
MANLRLPSSSEVRALWVARALHAIAGSDPGFDTEALLRELPARFIECSQSRISGDAGRLRSCLTPALLEQWEKEEALQVSTSAESSSTSVEDVRLVWAQHGPNEDRLVVGIDCLSQVGDTVHAPTEYWVLVRPAGAQTFSGRADECPDCGAPSGEQVTLCRYCGAALGPLRGWLLDQADDEIDWYEGPPPS